MGLWSTWFTSLLIILNSVDGYKILLPVILPGRSHGILGEGMVRHLLEGGHEVTYITPFPPKPRENLTIVDVSETLNFMEGLCNVKDFMDGTKNFQSLFVLMDMLVDIGRLTFRTENVQKLFGDKSQKFDLIITEWLFHDLNAAFAALYDCPFIWLSSLEPHWMVLRLMDEMPNPAYVSDMASNNAPPFTFLQRIEELVTQIYGTWTYYYYIQPKENQIYEEYFVPHIRSRNKPISALYDIKYNASLMFGNSHVSLGEATRLPQNYIPIGGFHIETDVKPLPQDLQKLMDNAKYGVIYFSLGSNLRSEDLPETLTRGILNIFSKLRQTVIWKFEKDLPNRPKNVHIVHWAPQQSILAHPKTLFFISHGGLLSTTESVHFGVPMITIPVMVDQFVNANRAVRKGFAIKVDLSYTMEKDLEAAIQTMLKEPKYSQKAKELSYIYHDRPVPMGKEILHWVNHVIKTRGALHLRSPALYVPWHQKMFLDLIILILIIISAIVYIAKWCLSDVKKKNTKIKRN